MTVQEAVEVFHVPIELLEATQPGNLNAFGSNTDIGKERDRIRVNKANLKIYLALGFLLALFLFLMVWKIILKK